MKITRQEESFSFCSYMPSSLLIGDKIAIGASAGEDAFLNVLNHVGSALLRSALDD